MGGLYLPDQAKDKSQWAEVIATSDSLYWDSTHGKMVTVKPIYKEGAKVLIPIYGTVDVEIEGTNYSLIKENEVLGELTLSKLGGLTLIKKEGKDEPDRAAPV